MGKQTLSQRLQARLSRHERQRERREETPPAPQSSERGRFLAGIRARRGGRYCTPPRPGQCTDCSGLVCEEFQRATGRTITCGSHEQYRDLAVSDSRAPLPGDLLFYKTGETPPSSGDSPPGREGPGGGTGLGGVKGPPPAGGGSGGGQRSGNRASHVGVYIGNGRAIHAMNEAQGIIETDMALPYWRGRFLGVRRLPFVVSNSPAESSPALPIHAQMPFRQTGDLSEARLRQILAGTPLVSEAAAIVTACKGLAALPVAQSWFESRYGQDANARATRNPLGLLDYSGRHPVRWIDDRPLRVFPSWAAAFAEWTRRVSDPSYKEGVYQPAAMTLEQFIVTYVAGPGCWRSRGANCANGESWAFCQRYLEQTVARLNRYHGLSDPDPPHAAVVSPGVPLRRAIIPSGNPNRPGTRITPSWITIHETGNQRAGANAEGHRDFTHRLRGGPEHVSFHYVVDDREAIQLLEHDEMAWHAGDGCDDPQGDLGCFHSIAIETCINADGNWTQTKRNLVALVRHLLRTDPRFSPEHIAQHHRWSGKDCPQRLRAEGTWDQLLNEVRR